MSILCQFGIKHQPVETEMTGVRQMATKAAKKVKESFKVVKKRNGRWSVKGNNGKFINGEEKVKILAAKGLVKVLKKKEGAAPAAAE
jgi:membrane-bound ClpP family serine protease